MKVILHGDEHAAGLQFYKAPKSWIDALEHCHNQDSSLAEIHNQTVQASVNSSLLNKDSMLNGMWIGLERSIFGRNSTWKWISGTPVGNHCPWNKSYPVDALNHHCGKIIWVAELGQFKWLDACCHEELPFICQSNQIYSVIHFLFWMKGLAERFSPRFFFLISSKLPHKDCVAVWRLREVPPSLHRFIESWRVGRLLLASFFLHVFSLQGIYYVYSLYQLYHSNWGKRPHHFLKLPILSLSLFKALWVKGAVCKKCWYLSLIIWGVGNETPNFYFLKIDTFKDELKRGCPQILTYKLN